MLLKTVFASFFLAVAVVAAPLGLPSGLNPLSTVTELTDKYTSSITGSGNEGNGNEANGNSPSNTSNGNGNANAAGNNNGNPEATATNNGSDNSAGNGEYIDLLYSKSTGELSMMQVMVRTATPLRPQETVQAMEVVVVSRIKITQGQNKNADRSIRKCRRQREWVGKLKQWESYFGKYWKPQSRRERCDKLQ